jgi:hypothetical protein
MTGSLNCINTNYFTINLSSYGTSLSSYGISSSGFTPNSNGYTFTMWGYYLGSGHQTLFTIGDGDNFFAIKPEDRVSFGPSNYNGWNYGSTPSNTWVFYALAFPPNSNTLNLYPTLYVYYSGSINSYQITPQVSSGGTMSSGTFSPFIIGYAGSGVSYIGSSNYNGYISDFRAYNTYLGVDYLTYIYNGTC